MSANVEPLPVFKERSIENKWYIIPKRYVQAVLGFSALFIIFWMRTSFIAAVFQIMQSQILNEEQKISWTAWEIYMIDSAFTWGFTAAQIPGALLTLKFSCHRVLLVSMILTIILHIVLPFSLTSNVACVIILRLLQGIVEGPLFPTCTGIWKSWAPPAERTILFCIVLCGSYFGSVAGYPLNMVLAEKLGEKACFFVSTAAGLIWCLLWIMQIYESPSSHPHISHYELSYLEQNIDVDNKLEITIRSIPWKSMLTSLPVWAIFLASMCYFFSQYILLISPYLYIQIELEFLQTHTVLDVLLPNIIIGAVILASGFIADALINIVNLRRSLVRKLFCCGAFTFHGISLLVVRYYKNIESTVICINLAHGFLGLSLAGYWINCLDFSPYYATFIMALCQTFGSLSDLIAPMILSALWRIDIMEWSRLFDALITTSFVVSLVYAFFGSGDVQWWGKPEMMHTAPAGDESLRSTYYSYPDGEDCVELVGDGKEFSDVCTESEKDRY